MGQNFRTCLDKWTNAKLKISESEIYRALYGDAMLVPIQMDTNMAAVK